jgi:hypothetical protein
LTLGEFDSGKAQRRAARVGLGAVAMRATRGLFPAMTGENAMSGGASGPPFWFIARCFDLVGALALIFLWRQGWLRDVTAATSPPRRFC